MLPMQAPDVGQVALLHMFDQIDHMYGGTTATERLHTLQTQTCASG